MTKTYVVAGATSGIGQQVTAKLAGRGATVHALSRRGEQANAPANVIHSRARCRVGTEHPCQCRRPFTDRHAACKVVAESAGQTRICGEAPLLAAHRRTRRYRIRRLFFAHGGRRLDHRAGACSGWRPIEDTFPVLRVFKSRQTIRIRLSLASSSVAPFLSKSARIKSSLRRLNASSQAARTRIFRRSGRSSKLPASR